jgi:hypothetical protein
MNSQEIKRLHHIPKMSFVSSHKTLKMAHHEEPQENEIAGPVTFALFLFAIVVLAIAFMA